VCRAGSGAVPLRRTACPVRDGAVASALACAPATPPEMRSVSSPRLGQDLVQPVQPTGARPSDLRLQIGRPLRWCPVGNSAWLHRDCSGIWPRRDDPVVPLPRRPLPYGAVSMGLRDEPRHATAGMIPAQDQLPPFLNTDRMTKDASGRRHDESACLWPGTGAGK
jgi:hypothetical protein